MKEIIVIGGFSFSKEQEARLAALGNVAYRESPSTAEEWLEIVKDYDVICSDGSFLYTNIHKLENKLVTYPFIELGSFNSDELAAKNVYVANTSGSNRDSIVQWTIFMAISLFRKFPTYLNTSSDLPFEWSESLSDHKALIVGKGSIGTEIGNVLTALGTEVDYFGRGDDLGAKAKGAKLVINALNCNPSSENLLDESFFQNLDKGTYYASFVRTFTYDLDAVISALDVGVLAGAAIDCDPESPFTVENEFYQKVLSHDKILATPHVAFATNQAKRNGTETVVRNVEAFLSGAPINILKKK